ncbi:predicted protein [Nematostella vectensis]|uniref:DUF6729 domain-containing protein n=1 Tax=Nematostella vectensis TaxID=45351 RepID=A7T342_NEMVE|nr:predicted protein [Nematostella vectensis]|eukprot:XP_001621723.1 hypothetical protein NEMVEDRAFT_v1g221645 [Nematostella vectensis]
MPRKLWKVLLKCPQEGCNRNLTSAGLYQKTRQVVDIDGNYNLVAEYLECGQCKKKVISWSPAIVSQLDPGHKLQFPVILTYKYACDVRVVRMLRNRGLGNSSSMLQKKLTEQHSEKWLQKTIHYLTECAHYNKAAERHLVSRPNYEEPPTFNPPPNDPRTMPRKQNNNFPIGTYAKKKRAILEELCEEKVNALSEIKLQQQNIRRLKEKVENEARARVREAAGDASNTEWVLSKCSLQFGIYRGKTFIWLLSNDCGWAVMVLASHETKRAIKHPQGDSQWDNKEALRRYAHFFPPLVYSIQDRINYELGRVDLGAEPVGFGPFGQMTRRAVLASKSPKQISQLPVGQPGSSLDVFLQYARGCEQAEVQSDDADLVEALDQYEQSQTAPYSLSPLEPRQPLRVELLDQPTGKPWGTVNLDPEQPDDLTAEEEDDMDDEVFLEMDEDPTVPTLLAPRAFATAPSVSEVPASTVPSSSPLRCSPGPSGVVEPTSQTDPVTFTKPGPTPGTSMAPSTAEDNTGMTHIILFPDGWRQTLPKEDHKWIARSLFKVNASSGKAELDFTRADKLWCYPSQPQLISSQPPNPTSFFFWAPKRTWNLALKCDTACQEAQSKKGVCRFLSQAGLYKTVRRVLDIDSHYFMATEYLECKECTKKFAGWSKHILDQLDLAKRTFFPALLTYRYSCDMKVVRLLRQRGLGNSSTQIQKKIAEQHEECHLQRVARFLQARAQFHSGRLLPVAPPTVPLPEMPAVPRPAWFLSIFLRDVMTRMDVLKAEITSSFGAVLKMDSTKKVVKKVAGKAAGTSSWLTNVGNEFGIVLMSVLADSEGEGLAYMAAGLVQRYRNANVISWSPAIYLTECAHYNKAAERHLVSRPNYEEPPTFNPPPKYRWLLSVYGLDIMNRMDQIKASITSTFGTILKMDSTKKIVLMSVLTATEGQGLQQMAWANEEQNNNFPIGTYAKKKRTILEELCEEKVNALSEIKQNIRRLKEKSTATRNRTLKKQLTTLNELLNTSNFSDDEELDNILEVAMQASSGLYTVTCQLMALRSLFRDPESFADRLESEEKACMAFKTSKNVASLQGMLQSLSCKGATNTRLTTPGRRNLMDQLANPNAPLAATPRPASDVVANQRPGTSAATAPLAGMDPQLANLILGLQQKVEDLTRQNKKKELDEQHGDNDDAPVGAENNEETEEIQQRPKKKKKKQKALA